MWSSKSLGSRFRYGFFQTLIKMGLGHLAGKMIFPVPLYYALRPEIRRRAAYYLERRFPGETGTGMLVHTFLLYNNFANVLYDRIMAGAGVKLPILHDGDTVSMMQEILGKGNGCIVVGAHFGCWQTGLLALADFGRPTGVVFWQEEKIEHSFFHYENEVTIINANGGLGSIMEMRALLRRNGILCIMGDRMTPGDRHSARVNFLGGEIEIPTFPYLLSEKTGAPVLHAASIRRRGRITGLQSVLNNAKSPLVFIEYLKNLVTKYPHDFFNFYNMWEEGNEKKRVDRRPETPHHQ